MNYQHKNIHTETRSIVHNYIINIHAYSFIQSMPYKCHNCQIHSRENVPGLTASASRFNISTKPTQEAGEGAGPSSSGYSTLFLGLGTVDMMVNLTR